MEEGLQRLLPGRPSVSRIAVDSGRTGLLHRRPTPQVDGLSGSARKQPVALLCMAVFTAVKGFPARQNHPVEGCGRVQTPAASTRRHNVTVPSWASSREGSEASPSPSTSGQDEDLGLTTPSTDALPGGIPELYDNTEAERTLLQLGARWREMTKQSGAALPPEAAQLQQQQISQLSASLRQAKMRSTVELLGRKPLAMGEELPLTPADPASRILEALLNVPDQTQRLQMLPAALQAPDAASSAAEDVETELLWTTPVWLLQAIDLALLRMQRPVDGSLSGEKLLSNGDSSPAKNVQRELQVLREEVFRIWESDSNID